jgi:uncharacterized protein YodC (DUF2158 family)
MAKFKPGDKVRHIINGRDMAISHYHPGASNGTSVYCSWFEGMQLEANWFEEDKLELIPPSQGAPGRNPYL